jgi:hypothetical protein
LARRVEVEDEAEFVPYELLNKTNLRHGNNQSEH